MAFRITDTDQQVLISIAEHRLLNTDCLSILQQRHPVALRRRLSILVNEDLIQTTTRGPRGTRGRPEKLLFLTEEGVALLKANGLLDKSISNEQVTIEKLYCLDHQMLTNDFRIQLVRMQRDLSDLDVRFLAPTSPFLPRVPGTQPLLQENVPSANGSMPPMEFVPDGVFKIAHRKLHKTLLFFLETDMGTQSLSSQRHPKRDIRQKIGNYQAYFRSQGYKRYQEIFQSELRGFRLLILTENPSRLPGLCQIVRRMAPADFVWLTDRATLESTGVWAAIWVRGGNDTQPRESILGSQAPNPSPAPEDIA